MGEFVYFLNFPGSFLGEFVYFLDFPGIFLIQSFQFLAYLFIFPEHSGSFSFYSNLVFFAFSQIGPKVKVRIEDHARYVICF